MPVNIWVGLAVMLLFNFKFQRKFDKLKHDHRTESPRLSVSYRLKITHGTIEDPSVSQACQLFVLWGRGRGFWGRGAKTGMCA